MVESATFQCVSVESATERYTLLTITPFQQPFTSISVIFKIMPNHLPLLLTQALATQAAFNTHFNKRTPTGTITCPPGKSPLREGARLLGSALFKTSEHNGDSTPEFDLTKIKLFPPHADLSKKLAGLEDHLPIWQAQAKQSDDAHLFVAPNVKRELVDMLGAARVLSDEIHHGVWADLEALKLLNLVGEKTIIEAYSHANQEALERCAVAFTFMTADQAITDRLSS